MLPHRSSSAFLQRPAGTGIALFIGKFCEGRLKKPSPFLKNV